MNIASSLHVEELGGWMLRLQRTRHVVGSVISPLGRCAVMSLRGLG